MLKKLPSRFYFQGFVDTTDAVAEANEGNNRTVKTILKSGLMD